MAQKLRLNAKWISVVIPLVNCFQAISQTSITSSLPLVVIGANGAAIQNNNKISDALSITAADGGGVHGFDVNSGNSYQYLGDVGELLGDADFALPAGQLSSGSYGTDHFRSRNC